MKTTSSPPKAVPITASTTKKKPRGRPFAVGNTMSQGRPKGCLNRSTVVVRELLSVNAQAVTEKVLALAKKGDPMAMRVVMDRIAPLRAGAPIFWDMPPIHCAEDVLFAYRSMLEAVSVGDMTPHEGMQVKTLLEGMHNLFNSSSSTWGPAETAALIGRYERMRMEDTVADQSPNPEDATA